MARVRRRGLAYRAHQGVSGTDDPLSHHQLFSAFGGLGAVEGSDRKSACNPHLRKTFERFLATGRPIPAWFWGHEHSLYVYEPHLGLAKGRCVGHGAVPVFASEAPYVPDVDLVDLPKLVSSVRIQPAGNTYGHGFAMLELEPSRNDVTAIYYEDVHGATREVFRERLLERTPVAAPPVPNWAEVFAPAPMSPAKVPARSRLWSATRRMRQRR